MGQSPVSALVDLPLLIQKAERILRLLSQVPPSYLAVGRSFLSLDFSPFCCTVLMGTLTEMKSAGRLVYFVILQLH